MLKSLKKCEWKIAIREREDKLLFEPNGCKKEFIALKNTFRYWCADPFLIDFKDRKYVFFELYDRLKRKGLIGYREIKGNKLGKIRKAFECNAHLSYPFIYEKENNLFIIPESNNLNKVILLKCDGQQKKLKFGQVDVLAVLPLADATFFTIDSENYAFATPVSDSDNVSTLCAYTVKDGKLIPWINNPIVSDKSSARMAGKIINFNQKLIRCSQNCAKTYGGGIVFSEIKVCNDNNYCEQKICSILPEDIQVKGLKGKFDGIHTYNFDEKYEVIDCKRNAKFSLCECIGYLFEKLHLVNKVTRAKETE